MIHGLSVDTARRYIKTIDEIGKIVDKIYAIAYMMSAFSEIEDGAKEGVSLDNQRIFCNSFFEISQSFKIWDRRPRPIVSPR
jgi:hypothetical protein